MAIRISTKEYAKIESARKKNKNKRVEKLLEVLTLRYEGKSNAEISAKTGYNNRYITTLMGKYQAQGLEEFIRIKQTSHNRRLTEEEEAEVLSACKAKAEAGQMLTAAEIKEAFDKRIGAETAVNYVYRVMKRHEWRSVMPRPKHPKAASQEEQDSSKKLRH